ncbi:MAG: hypothetical protein F2667_11665 [Actinobacteria bacterium]|uniref:Unannotated protein n=1 Tax=freshwater metagenome TaxID=449393 RepID=A0A6J6RR05_9ZZZZ|nr:hypothetical protein [Actinomycetota bacterium]
MTVVDLREPREQSRIDRLPRRVRLRRPVLERLAEHASARLPWPVLTTDPADDDELRGLLDATLRLPAELLDAFAVLSAPGVAVDLDLVLRRRDGREARARAWHRLRDGRVTTVSTAGGDVELGWSDDTRWAAELTRFATVGPAQPQRRPDLRLPHELLLGLGEAVRRDRSDLVHALLARHPLSPEETTAAVRLHTAAQGRLQAVVSSPDTHRVGWVSWLRLPEGWLALTPYVERRGAAPIAMVRVHRVEATHLAGEVARLAMEVGP